MLYLSNSFVEVKAKYDIEVESDKSLANCFLHVFSIQVRYTRQNSVIYGPKIDIP